MTDGEADVSRRGFLGATSGVAATAAATSNVAAQTGSPGAGTATPAGGEVHTVEMTDDLVYVPDSITIAPGDTIEWVNVGSIGHTVTAYADEIPDAADYFASGEFDSMDAAISSYAAGDPDAGYIPADGTYSHTFETVGEYQYFCIPHEAAGMVGSVTVSEGGGQAVDGGGGAVAPNVPDAARNFAVILSAGLLGILSFTYMLIRYGGDYSWRGEE